MARPRRADAGAHPVSDTPWTQLAFAEAGMAQPHARMTDPVSSDLTIKSLGRDTSYSWRIFTAVMVLSERTEERMYDDGISIAVMRDRPVTDDDILTLMERDGRRYQRNVIARQRGLLREAGWIRRVDDVEGRTGRPTIAHVPTWAGIDTYQAHLRETSST
jgi:hypothetical protein